MRYVEFSQARKSKPKVAPEVDAVDPANPKVVRIPAGGGLCLFVPLDERHMSSTT